MASSIASDIKAEKTVSEISEPEYPPSDEKHTSVVAERTLLTKSNQHRTFDGDSTDSFYKPIDSYEGRHRWDPEFQWEEKEERRLVRKVSLVLD